MGRENPQGGWNSRRMSGKQPEGREGARTGVPALVSQLLTQGQAEASETGGEKASEGAGRRESGDRVLFTRFLCL